MVGFQNLVTTINSSGNDIIEVENMCILYSTSGNFSVEVQNFANFAK